MIVFGIWLRRGVGARVALLVAAFVLFQLFSRPEWENELDWATRLTGASLLLVCPCLGAAAAYDTAQRMRPTLADLSRGSPRHWLHIALPAAAVVAWSVAAYVLVWAVAAVVVTARGGVGITDWWVFAEVIAPLVGAGAVGLCAGMAVSGPLAAPIAAVTVLGGTMVASPWGRGPFEAVTTYGTLTGLERPAVRSAAAVGAALLVGAVAAFTARQRHRTYRGRGGPFVLAGCAVLAAVAVILPAAWPWDQDVYVPTSERYGCIGDDPSVCAPRSRLQLLQPVQASLADAYARLHGTDFTRPTTFRVTRGDFSNLGGAAPLEYHPEDVRGDGYDTFATAEVLMRPHACAELYGGSGMDRVFNAQDVVRPWLERVIKGQAPGAPVPPEVASAFDVIQGCHAQTGDR